MVDEKILESALRSLMHPGESDRSLPKEESETKPTLYLFRHGETDDNKERIFSGWRDARLTPRGVEQAEILAEKLRDKRIDLGIHSPLSRSIQTLTIVLQHHPDAQIEEDDRIIERNYGDLSGTSKVELMNKDPELATQYRRGYAFPPPNGESIKMVEERVFPFCDELVERMKRERIRVAISAHSNSMRVLRRFFEHLTVEEMLTHENPLGQDYASYVID